MSTNDDNSDLHQINSQTWNKLHESAAKAGFRDGISDGRDSNFQLYFDRGYSEGFKNGFALGQFKGFLNTAGIDDPTLSKTTRGNCQICAKKDLENASVPYTITIQTEETNKLLSELHEKYVNADMDIPKTL